jgi:hypothetical protein
MRQRAKIDDNQPQIVKALQQIGCSVQSLAACGKGVPDLLVGYRGVNILLEVKDGSKPPSAQRLTPDEERFVETWRGPRAVASSLPEVLEILQVHGLWKDMGRAPVLRLPRDSSAGQTASGAAPTTVGG